MQASQAKQIKHPSMESSFSPHDTKCNQAKPIQAQSQAKAMHPSNLILKIAIWHTNATKSSQILNNSSQAKSPRFEFRSRTPKKKSAIN
jgi:hypothetical protein